MDLEMLIVVVFCVVDDFVRELCRERRLRQRGPAPVLADSEVLTIKIVGAFLGLDTDRALHAHFRRHFGRLFPGVRLVHPTTLARQAANLWAVKFALWHHLAAAAQPDTALVLVDSLQVPVCRFAPPYRCQSFRGAGRLRLRRLGPSDLLWTAPAPVRRLARRRHRGHTCAR